MGTKEEEFQKIFTGYYPKIVRYLRRLTGEAEAEDVAQEVFMKVSRALDGFRGEASLSTWVYRIATNAAMDHLRKAGTRYEPLTPDVASDDDSPMDAGALDSDPRLDTLLIRKDMNDCIRGIVDSLPENYRTVLVLSDLEGFANAEIADVLDITLDTVKIRLHRARGWLRKELEANCNFYRDERNELACDRKTTALKFLNK